MDLNLKSGESTAGAVGAAEAERGQGDAKDKPILKRNEVEVNLPNSGDNPESLMRKDSNSNKEGSVEETEHKVKDKETMSDSDMTVTVGPGVGDKPAREENSIVRPETLISVDSNSGSDKEGTRTKAKKADIVTISDILRPVDPVTSVGSGDKPPRDENYTDIPKLMKARQDYLKQKQMTRRAAWLKQTKVKLDKLAEYKPKLEKLPREIFTHRDDMEIMSQISDKWRTEFMSERTQFLFKKVFHVLFLRDSTSGKLPIDEVLKCRIVSKEWDYTIYKWLSNTSQMYHLTFSNPPRLKYEQQCTLFITVDGQLGLAGFNRMNDQLSEAGCPTMKPCPFRQLYIGSVLTLLEGYQSLGSTYWMEMEKLLQRSGEDVWTAVYIFEDGSIEMMYDFLIRYLSLMPNLRELNIIERDRSENVGADMLRSLGKDVLGPLKLMIERKPLPELPQLHTLFLAKFVPAPLVKAMLEKYGAGLKIAKIEGPGLDKYSGEYVDVGGFVSGRELPFIKEFSCAVLSHCSQISHWNFQFPQLSELCLAYHMIQEGAEVENIFKTVNSCGSTIRRLHLKIMFNAPLPKVGDDWQDLLPEGMKFELPHLEWLHLTLVGSKLSDVDFLLPLVSLKELSFFHRTVISEPSAKEGKGIIQFAGYRDRLYDSNIWNLLPEIKLVKISSMPIESPKPRSLRMKDHGVAHLEETNMATTIYTREGYRQHHSEENKGMLGIGIQQLTEQFSAYTLE